MRYFISSVPFLVILIFLAGLSMYLPAIHASIVKDHDTAQILFYFGTLIMMLSIGLAVATSNRVSRHITRRHLLTLTSSFVLLPVLFALPFFVRLETTEFFNAYLEMLSCFTTTGATLFPQEGRLPASLHLWRAQVGWLGGLWILIAAGSILAPLQLGGFEVLARQQTQALRTHNQIALPNARILNSSMVITPVYLIFTIVLWFLIFISGETATDALILAMSTLSTSGITAHEGHIAQSGNFFTEAMIFGFLFLGVTRASFAKDIHDDRQFSVRFDRELRLALGVTVLLPSLLFVRHWSGALEVEAEKDLMIYLSALWGGAFTVLSFLTTTGFESASWTDAQKWSGLGTPGIMLLGLAMLGGGVATTAGGIKLLRIYALYRHNSQELAYLVHPNGVSGARDYIRRIPERGIYAAWIFFMLFIVSLAGIAILFSLSGLDFETSLVLTISGLSTTGPLTALAGAEPISMIELSFFAKAIFSVSMILGRLETLAIIALFNPDFWRM